MNVLKCFSRNFRANRQSYLINMLSLVPGLACCLLIMLWIVFEIGTDRSYPHIDRITTVCGYHEEQRVFRGAPPAVAPTVKQEMPEVEAATRVAYAYDGVTYGTEKFNMVSNLVDADIFKIFGLEFAEGIAFKDDEVDKCVISEKAARTIFGGTSPVGKFLGFDTLQYVVCGVTKDLPKNSTLNIDLFLPIRRGGEPMAWYNNSFMTYVLLKDARSFDAFKAKVKDRAMTAQPENKLYLEAGQLKDRYLVKFGNMKNVRLMGMIALFVLIIACINFINLSTAGFMKSSFQTGIRKLVGATRGGLILSNYINTFLLVIFSFLLAFALAILILPWFNGLIGRSFVLTDFFTPSIMMVGGVVVLATALLAGTYPAFYMASFQPIKVLKSRNGLAGKSSYFRNTLVVTQFVISITLIICTFVISKQIRMFQQMDLGYQREEVVYVNLGSDELKKNAKVLKAELLKEPTVLAACISMNTPTNINWNGTGWSWEGKDPSEAALVTFAYVDEDWAKVLGVKFKEGQFFDKNSTGQVVINDRLAEMMGGGLQVDKYINRGEPLKIVGVLNSFMFNNFKAESAPLVLFPMPEEYFNEVAGCVMVRAGGTNLTAIYDLLKKKAMELNGGEVVEVSFLDDNVENMLYAEKQSTQMVSFFSILSIIISCLGLFGLATFMMEQKRKEIGLRRVNGAKISEIVWLLNLNFIRPVAIAFVIACPLAWYAMSRWLESYMQRTELSWWLFLAAGMIVTVIAVLTLVWRSVKAATANPVESLKNE